MPASSRHSRTKASRTAGFTPAVTAGVMEASHASHANALAAWPSSHAAAQPPTRRRAYYGGMETLRFAGQPVNVVDDDQDHRAGLDHCDQPSRKARSKAHGSARRTSVTLTD